MKVELRKPQNLAWLSSALFPLPSLGRKQTGAFAQSSQELHALWALQAPGHFLSGSDPVAPAGKEALERVSCHYRKVRRDQILQRLLVRLRHVGSGLGAKGIPQGSGARDDQS